MHPGPGDDTDGGEARELILGKRLRYEAKKSL